MLDPKYYALLRKLDLACTARDLPAAKRNAKILFESIAELHPPAEPLNPWRIEAILATYAQGIHGWDIADV